MNTVPIILFVLLGVIWGSNFIYMKWASEYISPTQIVYLRVLFGFIPVLLYSLIRRELKVSHLRFSGHFFVMSCIATIVYYFGFVKGSELLYSGVAGALSGAIPIFSFIAALMFIPEEKLSPMRLAGISMGFLGIMFIANPFATNLAETNIEGALYMAMGSFSVGVSFVYAKKFILPLKIPSSALTVYQLGFALLLLSIFTKFDGLDAILDSTHVVVGTVLGLGILGTGLAYVIYYYLIEKLGAVSASSVTYVPPIVALAIGAILVGESISVQEYVAVVLIFAGVFLINKEKKYSLRKVKT